MHDDNEPAIKGWVREREQPFAMLFIFTVIAMAIVALFITGAGMQKRIKALESKAGITRTNNFIERQLERP